MEIEYIKSLVKSSFCNLTGFKIRDSSLEVLTAFSTINNKFVSVFITLTRGKIIVTDNGWIDQNYYDFGIKDTDEHIVDRIINSFRASYKVKTVEDKVGVQFNYKVCENAEQIPSAVFDLANFIVGVVNAHCIQLRDEIEERERETFKQDANNFLKGNYDDNVILRKGLDDYKNIKFNAVINRGSNLYLISYVTGSSQYYFENDLRRSIVNFEISERSIFKSNIKERIVLINDFASGYSTTRSHSIYQLLDEKISRNPIKWSEKEKILEIV